MYGYIEHTGPESAYLALRPATVPQPKTLRFSAVLREARVFTAALTLLLACGCGREESPVPEPAVSSPAAVDRFGFDTEAASAGGIQQVSAEFPAEDGEDGERSQPPAEGSPEWFVHRIVTLRVQPLPADDDVDVLRKARFERNLQIIELAEQSIAASHNDPSKKVTFEAATHHLLEARRQLALLGDAEQIELLYENADALYRRDPASKAAADAAFTVVRFTHESASRFGQRDPRWLTEFARRARLFAKNFPHEEHRAAPLMLTAGWTCELQGLRDEAFHCYQLLQEQFPHSAQARQAVGIVRRLNLIGQRPEFAGPTLDGNYITLDDFRGRVVLISFWAADVEQCLSDTARLLELSARHKSQGLQLVGVGMEADETALRAFLEKNKIDWPQLFSPDPAKRRWDNPLVAYYGIRDIPSYWLIDRDGLVQEMSVDLHRIEERLPGLLSQR